VQHRAPSASDHELRARILVLEGSRSRMPANIETHGVPALDALRTVCLVKDGQCCRVCFEFRASVY
jgi:hypothetical protein